MTQICAHCGQAFEALNAQRQICFGPVCRNGSNRIKGAPRKKYLTEKSISLIVREANEIRKIKDDLEPVNTREQARLLCLEVFS